MFKIFSFSSLFPFLRWGRNLDKETVRCDFIAGLTGALLVLPQGVAFATIAGMPPEYGLYASIVPAIIAALFGSSWHLVSGPTTAASIVMYSSLITLAEPGTPEYISLAITLAFMVGVIQLVMGLVRLGALVNFISHSVIIGFTAGAAVLIMSKQAKAFFGVATDNHGEIYLSIGNILSWDSNTYINPLVTAISITTIISILFFNRKWPKLPGMVLGIVFGSVVAWLVNRYFGESTARIDMVGALPMQLPPLSLPDFSLEVFQQLAPLALAMTLFALTEAVSISRSVAIESGQSIQGNQEFLGQGLSNIAGSFFSSYVATGSFNRTAANHAAGARTPLAATFAGIFLIPVIFLVAPLTGHLPTSVVAGLLVIVSLRIINFRRIRHIIFADRKEATIMLVTFFSTLFFKLEFAILFGLLLSLLVFLRETSRPRLTARAPDSSEGRAQFGSAVSGKNECPQLKILRLDESLYFGSVAHVNELLRLYREHYPEQKYVLLLTKGVNQVDLAGAELLLSETKARRKMGGDLFIYRFKEKASTILKKAGYLDYIGENNIFPHKYDAIRSIFDRLDKDICRRCDKRVFFECQSIPVADQDAVVVDGQKPAIRVNSPVVKKKKKVTKKKTTKKKVAKKKITKKKVTKKKVTTENDGEQ